LPGALSEIVLHVGRNKAGSTTIQDFCLAARHELKVRGVEYVMFGHLADSQSDVNGFGAFEDLVADMRARPGRRRLVSNEFMFSFPDDYMAATARALAGSDVQVLAYIRPYDDWLISAYAEETRRGMNMRDIDEYLDWMWPRVSAWPHLRNWGECFGWDRLRVRDLSSASLHDGDLLSDFVHALGVSPISLRLERRNVAPHWIALELARELAERNGDTEWSGVSHGEVQPLLDVLDPLLTQAPPATYLGLAQRRRLRDLYNEDLARIRLASGAPLHDASPPRGPERSFAPSLEKAPKPILNAFFAKTAEPAWADAHPDAAARARRLRASDEGARRVSF
jgi:hypothetical protein